MSSISRAVSRASRLRSYAAAASGGAGKTAAKTAAPETDVVKRVFLDQQRKFRALLEKTKTLSPPVGGDANAVKAYATKKLAILKELDIATPGEKILDTVDEAFSDATTVRGFLDRAAEIRKALGLKEADATFSVLAQALDATEKTLGTPLMTSNAQGMAKYSAAVAKAAEAAGIKPLDAASLDKLRVEVDMESIENEILDLQSIEDAVKKEQV
ncbi:unnamed product [Ostreococcus tauri]|uniref:Unnamed product n=2 Tax=Ostreococcus tauri TaxID=70448 RepID=A0A090MAK1_OSTTA|nr:unnamed product [Ostreococcus tauri]CEF99752.1 unnamed product [Ostreococcus tauri]|eukprot:XP_022840010.1 unnamed product [Ostreococcus tauri]